MNSIISFTPQQRITNVLLLNASFIGNLGLLNGKMGIAIYFFHLAKETNIKIYEEYAGELIDEIYDGITIDTPFDFENGLAGVGWGIEYLAQNGFIEADTNNVLEEFDIQLFKKLIYDTPKEIGLLDGLVGLGYYFLKRTQNQMLHDDDVQTLTNKQTLIYVIDELERKLFNCQIDSLLGCSKPINVILEPENTAETTKINLAFNLVSDFPVLLWFLSELRELNIFNFKVDKLIDRLVSSLTTETISYQLHSNRVLLSLAFLKLEQSISRIETKEIVSTLLTNLLSGISRISIQAELPENNTCIKHGSGGIAWIYQQLGMMTDNKEYINEARFWHSLACDLNDHETEFSEKIQSEFKGLGLLEGIAGLNCINYDWFKLDHY